MAPIARDEGHAARRPLRVIAGAVLDGRRLLLVSKCLAPGVFYLPGGKPEAGEAWWSCLSREFREELDVEVRHAEFLIEVHSRAALEAADLHMTVYLARVDGAPRPAAELHSLAWWPEERPAVLAPAVADYVIPALEGQGLLRSAS